MHYANHPADWVGDYGCDGSKVWVCGTFQYQWQATYFRQRLDSAYHDAHNLAFVAIPDEHFCDANPDAVITVKTYDYTAKYDHTWTYSSGWNPNRCSTCVVDVTYTCPPPPKPKCNVCWEWTLSGCEDSYYNGDTCDKGVDKLEDVLHEIGYAGELWGSVGHGSK